MKSRIYGIFFTENSVDSTNNYRLRNIECLTINLMKFIRDSSNTKFRNRSELAHLIHTHLIHIRLGIEQWYNKQIYAHTRSSERLRLPPCSLSLDKFITFAKFGLYRPGVLYSLEFTLHTLLARKKNKFKAQAAHNETVMPDYVHCTNNNIQQVVHFWRK